MHIPRAFCVTDQMEMLIKKTGEKFEVFNDRGPYYKISCDTYYCRACGVVLALPAQRQIAIPGDEAYDRTHVADTLSLND